MQDVTAKSTKATILKAYEDARAKIDELQASQFDPVKIKQVESNDKAIKHVQTRRWDLENMFAELRQRVDGGLRGVQSELEQAKDELATVKQAKEALQAELEEIHGITVDANSFAALIEAQKSRREQFDTEMADARTALEAQLVELRETVERDKNDVAVEAARAREVWEYDFERTKKQKLDALDDELDQARREWQDLRAAEAAELAEREKAVAECESELEDLRGEVDGVAERIAAAEADGRKKAGQSAGIEINALKRNHEADIKILNNEVERLREVKVELDAKVAALELKLEGAYEKIQGVASKALDAQGNYRTTTEVQKAVAAAATSKKS